MAGAATRAIELALGFIGALLCSVVALLFAAGQASSFGSDLWPLPGLVFLEVITLGLLGLLAAALTPGSSHRAWGYIPWAVSGALASLVVLGGFSIGPFLFPSMLCFLVIGLLNRRRWSVGALAAAGVAASAALAQAAALLLPILLSGQP